MLWHCNYFNIVIPFDVMSDNVLQKKILSLKLLLVFRYHFPRIVEKVVFLIFSLVINIHSS